MAWRGSDCLCDAASCATPRGHASYLAWPMRSQMRSTRLAEQVHRREWHVRKRRSLAFATSSCVGSCYRERKASSSIRLVKTIQIGVRNVMVFSRKSLLEPVQSANFSRGLRPPAPGSHFPDFQSNHRSAYTLPLRPPPAAVRIPHAGPPTRDGRSPALPGSEP